MGATTLMITERRAYGIVDDLTRAGYLVKARDGRLVDAARGGFDTGGIGRSAVRRTSCSGLPLSGERDKPWEATRPGAPYPGSEP